MAEPAPFMQSLVKPELLDKDVFSTTVVEHLSSNRFRKRPKQCKPKQKKKLSRKEIKELGLYAIPHDTVKYEDALRLHNMWCEYIATLLPAKEIPHVTDGKYNTIVSSLLKADYHGAKIHIVRSKQPSVVGMKGIVVMDTKGTFKMVSKDNKLRTIPKNDSLFEVKTKDTVVTIFGKYLNTRPAERSVKKVKLFSIPDLE